LLLANQDYMAEKAKDFEAYVKMRQDIENRKATAVRHKRGSKAPGQKAHRQPPRRMRGRVPDGISLISRPTILFTAVSPFFL